MRDKRGQVRVNAEFTLCHHRHLPSILARINLLYMQAK